MNKYMYNEKTINELRNYLNTDKTRYLNMPKFIFLCGKAYPANQEEDNTNRGKTERYLEGKIPNAYTVLSEKSWVDDFNSDIDLLTFEEFLAEISDFIILFVESYGSACELGAFSYDSKLFLEKLLVIIDETFENDKSFINQGPVSKLKKNGGHIAYADLNESGSLLSSQNYRDSMNLVANEINKKKSINKKRPIVNEDQVYLNTFFIEFLELVRLLQPVAKSEVIYLYKKLKNFDSYTFVKTDGSKFIREIRLEFIKNLLISMELLQEDSNGLLSIHEGEVKKYFENIQAINCLFSFTDKQFNKYRAKLIARGYKYGKWK